MGITFYYRSHKMYANGTLFFEFIILYKKKDIKSHPWSSTYDAKKNFLIMCNKKTNNLHLENCYLLTI